jgi:hypothetical protein
MLRCRLLGLVLAACLLAGCHNVPQPSTTASGPKTPPITAPPPPAPSAPEPKATASKTPIKDHVEAFLAEQAQAAHPLLPSGVKLLHADLTDGVVTLDFSSEFNGLANMGDSVEGEAQKALCAALAPIAGVEKLKVTVEGKPYDSQMADWSTPFPVHGTTASAEGRGGQE